MSQQAPRFRSICGVIPPYVLDHIAQKGSAKQREAALRTKALDQTFRSLRIALQPSRYAPHRLAISTPMVTPQKHRTIYSAETTTDMHKKLVRTEGQGPSGDVAADEAYDGLGDTYDFYWEIFKRNSIDDKGMKLDGIVHYDKDYDNAFWDGTEMVFGDGDGKIFNRLTIAVDVIGHELTHGVTEVEAQLQYFNQSGALNESMSDVFGSLVKQYAKKQTADQADWLIGQGLLAPGIKGVALRSMKDPGSAFDDPILGKDPQPKDMAHFVQTFEDNGGVHINSGIPNRAFYEVATRIGGFAWEKPGHVWYETLRDANLKPDADFMTFAKLTYTVAGRLYTVNSPEQKAVKDGWGVVGLTF